MSSQGLYEILLPLHKVSGLALMGPSSEGCRLCGVDSTIRSRVGGVRAERPAGDLLHRHERRTRAAADRAGIIDHVSEHTDRILDLAKRIASAKEFL
jgi:hypothetical protein